MSKNPKESTSPFLETPSILQDLWNTHRQQTESFLRQRSVPFEVLPEHRPFRTHPNSQAQYPVEYRIEAMNALVLAQLMLPHSKTSEHSHPLGVTEEYHVIAGTLTIHFPNNQIVLGPGSSHRVLAREIHWASTDSHPSLTVILMRGVNGIPDDKLHDRLDPTINIGNIRERFIL